MYNFIFGFVVFHSVSLGMIPPLANHNPAILSVPPGAEELNKHLQSDKIP